MCHDPSVVKNETFIIPPHPGGVGETNETHILEIGGQTTPCCFYVQEGKGRVVLRGQGREMTPV